MKLPKLNTLFIAGTLFCASFNSSAQLSGTYTIGGSSPDFATPTDASNAIINQGINGPVVFNIRAGNYTNKLELVDPYIGSSNPITIQSEDLDANAVTIADEQAIVLDSTAKNITIQYLTLECTGTSSTDVTVLLRNGASNVEIRNNIVIGFDNNSFSHGIRIEQTQQPTTPDQICDNITVEDNEINLGGIGIAVYYSDPGFEGSVKIRNNSLNDFGDRAIRTYATKNLEIVANTITSLPLSGSPGGIFVDFNIGTGLIEGNTVAVRTRAVYASYVDENMHIVNNMIYSSNVTSSSGTGIVLDYLTGKVPVHHNTVRSSGPCIDAYCDVEVDIKNNVLVNTGGNEVFYLSYNNSIPIIPDMNHNAWYTTGDFAYVDWPYNQGYSHTDFVSTFNVSENSVYIEDYVFVNDSLDLHSCQDSLIGIGISGLGVEFDIDGQTRSDEHPVVGADVIIAEDFPFLADLPLCAGNTVELVGDLNANNEWSELVSGTLLLIGNTPIVDVSSPGEYVVEITGGQCAANVSDTLVVYDNTPVADFTLQHNYLTYFFYPTNNYSTVDSVFWDFGDGNTSTESEPMNIYDALGTYDVTLTIYNECGESTITKTIELTEEIAALTEHDQQFSMFPNPANDLVTISSTAAIQTIEVRDMSGKVVRTHQPNGAYKTHLDLHQIQPGMYFVTINQSTKQILKLIVR